MIIEARSRSLQVPAGQAPGRRSMLRRAELLHVMLEEPCELAVDGQEGSPEVEELLPFVVAVTHGPCVRPAVDRVLRIDHRGPAAVALGEQDDVAVAAHPDLRALRSHRLGAERHLASGGDELRLSETAAGCAAPRSRPR